MLHQIGARIFRRRHELGWTQNDLAQRLGIAPANIHRIEHGGRNLTIDTLCKLAVALDISVAELVIGAPDALAKRPE